MRRQHFAGGASAPSLPEPPPNPAVPHDEAYVKLLLAEVAISGRTASPWSTLQRHLRCPQALRAPMQPLRHALNQRAPWALRRVWQRE